MVFRRCNTYLLIVKMNLVASVSIIDATSLPRRHSETDYGNIRRPGIDVAQGIIGLGGGNSPPIDALIEAAEPLVRGDTGAKHHAEELLSHATILWFLWCAGDAPCGRGWMSADRMAGVSTSEKSGPPMKPMTAAKKLGIYLPAAPQSFQDTPLSHDEFVALQNNPPEWLEELRREGPHPRPEVARKLGITITALKNNGVDKPLTTADIKALLENQPDWLRQARRQLAEERERQQKAAER